MADETTTTTDSETQKGGDGTETGTEDQRVPYERFQQANKKAKEAADRAKALEKDIADLRTQIEERETAGLPELERLKKDMERAQKRADEAEQRATEADTRVKRAERERWITAAAQSANFADPSDASAFLDLDGIEDEKDAERAVKRLAGQKKHLVKAEDPKLPGQVLKDGQRPNPAKPAEGLMAERLAEAEMLRDGLKQFASPS